MSPGGSGISVSTTRAPSASSRSTYCSAARFSGSAGPPTDGGRVSSPTRQPGEPRRGHRRAGEHRPHQRDLRDRARHRARPCRRSGTSGNTPSTGIRPQLGLSPTTPQQAAGQADRAARVGAEPEVAEARGEGGGIAARRAAGRAAGLRRVLDGAVPGFWLVTPQANSCRFALPTSDRARREQPLDGRAPSGPGRGRRRSTSRRSSGSRPCRSGP